jgi:plasmid stabilization system protein ParE
MARVIWSEPALEHLQEIHAWIAQTSRDNASQMIERIIDATDRLVDFPESGRTLPERPGGPYRELIGRPYRVIYRLSEGNRDAEIVAVVHAHRQLPRLP